MKRAVQKDMRIALFPGSFDPFTNGHLDLARRASALFSEVIVAVAHNPAKTSLFTPGERVELIERSCASLKNVRAMHFGGLVVDFAKKCGARVIIRGLRAVSDFEFEFQMALMNRHLAPSLEIVFLMPDQAYTYLNSSLVKEVARHGGEIHGLVPPVVEKRLHERFGREHAAVNAPLRARKQPRGRS